MKPRYMANYLTYHYSVIPSTVTFLNINQDVQKEKSYSFVKLISGILISSLFSLNFGSRVDVSASGAPDYLIGPTDKVLS